MPSRYVPSSPTPYQISATTPGWWKGWPFATNCFLESNLYECFLGHNFFENLPPPSLKTHTPYLFVRIWCVFLFHVLYILILIAPHFALYLSYCCVYDETNTSPLPLIVCIWPHLTSLPLPSLPPIHKEDDLSPDSDSDMMDVDTVSHDNSPLLSPRVLVQSQSVVS